MDFSEAFRILQQRQQLGGNSAEERPQLQTEGQVLDVSGLEEVVRIEIPVAELYGEQLPEVHEQELEELSALSLLNLLLELQAKRVQTYNLYHRALGKLLEMDRLDQYQFVCANVTEQFNRINAEFRKLVDEFTRREQLSWVRLVQGLQTQEREKLTMVAALHLDDCREHWMHKNDSTGELESLLAGKASTTQKIQAVEEKVREIMDEVQIAKSELLETD